MAFCSIIFSLLILTVNSGFVYISVGFVALTVVGIKVRVIWDVTQCGLLDR
jgi:hypothetical protein